MTYPEYTLKGQGCGRGLNVEKLFFSGLKNEKIQPVKVFNGPLTNVAKSRGGGSKNDSFIRS